MPAINADSCTELGSLPPDGHWGVDGPDAIQGAAQIPGHQDMLFATNRRIYRYQLATLSWVELYDMWSDMAELKGPGGEQDTMQVLRGLLIR